MMLALLLLVQAPVTVQLNHEEFSRGDKARVYVQAEQDGYLVVLHADPDGRVRMLFPRDPTDDAFIRGGRRVEIRSRSDREAFMIDLEDGAGTVLAAISPDLFSFEGYVVNGHWDYRALGQGSVKDDPLAGLLDIVRRMSGDSHFEYDAATYVVGGGGEIASGYGYGHSYYYPHYRVRLGYYDPFYDPFCYDPFWSWRSSCFGYGYGYGSGFGFGVGYGFGSGFYPRRRPYGFGRPFVVSRPRVVIPAGTSRGRFTPVEPRPRSGTVSPPVRSFGGNTPRSSSPRSGTVAPRDRGGRSMSGGGRSAPRGGGSVSRPSSRPSNGGRSGSGGGRRH